MRVFRKFATSYNRYLVTKRDPFSFPSLMKRKKEFPPDLVFEFVPVIEVPKTRWEELKEMIVREKQFGQGKGGPVYYDIYRTVGKTYRPRNDVQSISQLNLYNYLGR